MLHLRLVPDAGDWSKQPVGYSFPKPDKAVKCHQPVGGALSALGAFHAQAPRDKRGANDQSHGRLFAREIVRDSL
jgi:hypothetical protein